MAAPVGVREGDLVSVFPQVLGKGGFLGLATFPSCWVCSVYVLIHSSVKTCCKTSEFPALLRTGKLDSTPECRMAVQIPSSFLRL